MPKIVLPAKPPKLPKVIGGTTAPDPALAGLNQTRAITNAPVDMSAWDPIVKLLRGTIQTPAQIAAYAQSQALATENATLAAQKAASDKIIGGYNDQAARAQGFARALGTLGTNEDQQALDRYTSAANTLTGLGTGLTGAVSDAYQGAVDRTRSELAQLTGGRGTVDAPSADAVRNASQYAGVTIPSTSLAADAYNAARLAGSDVSRRAQDLSIIGQGYTSQADQAISQAAADARATIGQRPATIAELVNTLTQNRTQGVQNLAAVLGSRASAKAAETARLQNMQQAAVTRAQNLGVAEQNRADTLRLAAQSRADRLKAQAFKQRMDLKQFLLSKGYVEAQTNQIIGNMTGLDANGDPTFASKQAARSWEVAKAGMAANNTKLNGYQTDWRGNAIVKSGHIIPAVGYMVDPNNPMRAVVDPNQRTPTSATLHPHGNISPSLSDRYGVQMYDDGTPAVGAKGGLIAYPRKRAAAAKPMSVKDRQGWIGQINQAADNLAKGWTDKDGTTHDAVSDPRAALQQMEKWGYLSDPRLQKWAMAALASAYPGYENAFQLGIGYGPSLSEAHIASPKDDPRFSTGKAWDAHTDPIKSFLGTQILVTKSGHMVGPDDKYL